jgi:hypothetical protein
MSTWTKTRRAVVVGPAAPRRVVLPRAGLSRWLLLLLAGLLIHCGDDPRPEEQGGALRFVWAVGDGGAEACERLSAVDFQATVFQRGQIVDSYSAPCSDFELETDLLVPNAEYMARATLVDELDLPKSATVSSSRFDITPEQLLDVTINFDANGTISVGPRAPGPIPVIR